MLRYQKAYKLSDLKKYEHWRPSAGDELADDATVYLRESLIVTKSAVDDQSVLFDEVTPAWRRFCTSVLHFSAPDWDAEAAEARRAILQDNPTSR